MVWKIIFTLLIILLLLAAVSVLVWYFLVRCPKNCSGHGFCNKWTKKCICHDYWKGKDCGTCPKGYGPECQCKSADPTKPCSGHGSCMGKDKCTCVAGYEGVDCSTQSKAHLNLLDKVAQLLIGKCPGFHGKPLKDIINIIRGKFFKILEKAIVDPDPNVIAAEIAASLGAACMNKQKQQGVPMMQYPPSYGV